MRSLQLEPKKDQMHILEEPQAPRSEGVSPKHTTYSMQHGEAAKARDSSDTRRVKSHRDSRNIIEQ